MGRREEDRLLEHDVGDGDPEEGPEHLHDDVDGDLTPRKPSLARVCEGYCGVEVSPGDRTEGEDESDESGTRRQGVPQERDGDVSARELLGHDPRPDDSREEQRRPEPFGYGAASQRRLAHETAGLVALMNALMTAPSRALRAVSVSSPQQPEAISAASSFCQRAREIAEIRARRIVGPRRVAWTTIAQTADKGRARIQRRSLLRRGDGRVRRAGDRVHGRRGGRQPPRAREGERGRAGRASREHDAAERHQERRERHPHRALREEAPRALPHRRRSRRGDDPPLKLKNAITSRIKIMASLDIAERRFPQDGRIKLKLGKGREMDFRISVLPTIWGRRSSCGCSTRATCSST